MKFRLTRLRLRIWPAASRFRYRARNWRNEFEEGKLLVVSCELLACSSSLELTLNFDVRFFLQFAHRYGGGMRYGFITLSMLLCCAIALGRTGQSNAPAKSPSAFEQTLMGCEKSFIAAA